MSEGVNEWMSELIVGSAAPCVTKLTTHSFAHPLINYHSRRMSFSTIPAFQPPNVPAKMCARACRTSHR